MSLYSLRKKWDRLAGARRRQKKLYRKTQQHGHLRRAAYIGKEMREVRKEIDRIANSPVERAIQWARKQEGTVENPAGSNRGPGITEWQLDFGTWLVGLPWCGVFVGQALKRGGVPVDSYVASVAAIEEHAKQGTHGFKSWHGNEAGRRGDAAVIGGHGVHVELIRQKVQGGYMTTGGNTSSGVAGSQDNGGGVWPRFRSFAEVHGVARPDYPTL